MSIEEARENIGAWVIYRPPGGPAEDGEITGISAITAGISGGVVFVRYRGNGHAKATYARDLALDELP